MIVAELEVHHSRTIAPTRRVALGHRHLPVAPPPGFGGMLLGGIVARFVDEVDPDLHGDLLLLTELLEAGQRIPQPRLRHRFQQDTVGLARSRHRLHRSGDHLWFAFEENRGAAAQHVLAAVYAAGELPRVQRIGVMTAIRRGFHWNGAMGPDLMTHLGSTSGTASWAVPVGSDPVTWALGLLDLDGNGVRPPPRVVQQRFRSLLRDAHPDHGGESVAAADRIRDLAEARRILMT